jgi:DNA-binding CsgD family transcriptional regulator
MQNTIGKWGKKPIQLSRRENEVMLWTACGKSPEEIGMLLGKHRETIRTQIKSACKKLNANNRVHAVALALTHNIIPYGPSPDRVISLVSLFGLTKEPLAAQIAPLPPRRHAHKKA